MQYLIVFLATFTGWITALGLFILARGLSRGTFIAFHYLADAILFGAIFFLYFKLSSQPLSSFAVMAAAMASLFIFEFILWRFIAPGQAHLYLNFVDWVIPAFIIASTIYAIGKYLN
ncbi:MAG: hypothetical protein R3251_04250 [Candidatus Spechtbacterales bacterium]|nr:hypothetical protein [Candidatus Spechtbacterales bacterium]